MIDSPSSPPPLRTMFLVTSLPVGGAETLLLNLVKRLDRQRFAPEVCCMKQPGELGEAMAECVPLHHGMTAGKFDPAAPWRLTRLMRRREIDAVVTVGAGDKMFWGRLAARWAGVPVIASALHSTGWPDGVGRLNRLLTPMTDAFIAVAKPHGEHLVHGEGFPEAKVTVIPNGVDTQRFAPSDNADQVRRELGLDIEAPVVGIVAALRPEKNHELLLAAIARVAKTLPGVQLLVIGDGPRCTPLKQLACDLDVVDRVHFLGSRSDVPDLLGAVDVVALTSHNEANPVSILEAMSVGKPVVATDVGSVSESVRQGVTGLLVPPGDEGLFAQRLTSLLSDRQLATDMGRRGRDFVRRNASLDVMVEGYENLLERLWREKTGESLTAPPTIPIGVAEERELEAAHS